MAGIEPASERFDPRISTSVVDRLISPEALRSTEGSSGQSLGPESPSFVCLAPSHTALRLSYAYSTTGRRSG